MFALIPCDRGCAIASNGNASQTKHENGKINLLANEQQGAEPPGACMPQGDSRQ